MLDYNLALYISAVFTGLALFFFYKPEEPEKSGERPRGLKSNRYQASAFLASLGVNVDQVYGFHKIADGFTSLEELSRGLRRAGVHSCQVIIGVDFTASNEWQGRKTFSGQCLHKVVPGKVYNPYQKVISILSQTLEPLFASDAIPCFGFGDTVSMDRDVFSLSEDGTDCYGFNEVLDAYNLQAQRVHLGGPTSFAPIIRRAMSIVESRKGYHILIVIADGQVTEENPTVSAIIAASRLPLSIIVVGVGDGPWHAMNEFDDRLPLRKFDNFQFVDYHSAYRKGRNSESSFALQALMEIPDQYREIRMLGYLD